MTSVIPPLKKRTKQGILYNRPPEVEEVILDTFALPFEEFMERARHKNRRHPEYLPSEVLVHRIRATRHNNSDEQFNALYLELFERVSRSCPRAVIRAEGGAGEVGRLMDVRDYVVDRFVTLIVKDRDRYEENLDIFEAIFDRAVRLMRNDAFRKVLRHEEPLTPLEYDESGDLPDDVEEYSSLLNTPSMTREEEITYRFRIRRAIDSLPEMERRVIDMLEAELPIESKNPDEPSIAGLLKCTPKTVRNRRARAIQKIRETLGVEACDVD